MKNRNPGKSYHPLAICLVFAGAGILSDRWLGFSVPFWFFAFLACLTGWFFCFIKHPNNGRGFHRTHLCILAALFCAFGGWHHYYWNCFPTDDIGFFASPEPHPVNIRGTVVESAIRVPAPPPDPGQPMATPGRIQFVIRVTEIRDGRNWIPASGKAIVYVDGDDTELPNYADHLKIFGTLFSPGTARNPGAPDSKARYKRYRIRAVVQVASGKAYTVERQSRWSLVRWQEAIRRNAQRNLHKYMGQAGSPLATAMILGFREDVSEETTQTLRETGTMHILAISGLHVGLIAGAFTLLLRLFGVPPRGVAILIMIIVLFYFSLTDMRPPAMRATLLICVACVAVFVRQKAISINSFSFTALIVLAYNPTELFQFGTQLSFLITSIFVWFPSPEKCRSCFPFLKSLQLETVGNSLGKKLRSQNVETTPGRELFFITLQMFVFQIGKRCLGLVENVFHLFLLSGVIFVISLPLILDNIHLMTPVALQVNPILWIPLTIALMCGFATMIFAWIFPPLAILFGKWGTFSFECLEQMLRFFHELPYGAFWYPSPARWWIFGFYLPLVFLTLFPQFRLRIRWTLFYFLIWSLLGYCSGYVRDWERKHADRLTVTVLSVGHGTSLLIQTPDGKTVIYDAGCFSRPSTSTNALSRCLWKAGKTHIDAIVLSHPDTDHFNAVPELSKRFSVGGIYVSPYMFDKNEPAVQHLHNAIRHSGIPLHIVSDGDTMPLDTSVEFSFLHPPAKSDTLKTEIEANASSLVLLVRHRDTGYLFPGDLDSKKGIIAVEFLRREPVLCEVLMVPHHGGNSNFTEPLIQWCQPKSLLISGGKFTYRPEVSENFRKRGLNVYHTFEGGYIRLTHDQSDKKIEMPFENSLQ